MKFTTLKYIFSLSLVLNFSALLAQNESLIAGYKKILQRGVSDSLYIKLNIDIADQYIFNNPDSSAVYTNYALARAQAIQDTSMMAKANNFLGIIFYSKGHLLTSLEHYQQAQALYKSIDDASGAVKVTNNIANVYTELGENAKAIKIYEEAFQTNIDLNLVDEAASNIFNIANSYLELKDYDKVKSYIKQLEDFNKISKTSIDPCFIKAEIFIVENQLDSAMTSLDRAITISANEGDELFVCSLSLRKAEVLLMKKDYVGAMAVLENTNRIIEKNDFNDLKLDFLKLKASLYKELGQFKEAFLSMEQYDTLKDSLEKMNNFNRVSELNAKYESEKKEADNARLGQEVARKDSLVRITLIIGIALIAILGVFIFNFFRKKRLNDLLKEQNNEIKIQRHKVISSINYARRIQSSILPNVQDLAAFLPESFIYFKPRDIVSGDFYWFRMIDERLYIAAIDCTGHGVPGAFMSLIANSKLNRTVDEFRLREPHEILHQLHLEIIAMLKQERDPLNAQDGMDIAICAIDMQKRTIRYSGANHGLIIGRAGELIEYKAKPISLGGIIYEKQLANLTNPFQTEEIPYNEGDYFFLFSDGLYDQLGGPENKKFNKARFRELLRNVLRMNDTKQAFALCESVFQNWRGSQPQTDDIMLIGAKLR